MLLATKEMMALPLTALPQLFVKYVRARYGENRKGRTHNPE